VRVDIRPIDQWISAYTARQQPASQLPKGTFTKIGNEYAERPLKMKKETILVHGFNVDQGGSQNFFRNMLGRLYWVGHPVLRRQGRNQENGYDEQGCADDCAHVVGLSWPGDVDGPISPGIRFPQAEFSALETGVPMARFLRANRQAFPNAFVVVLAHSLGNLAVNTALTRVEGNGSTKLIDTYVMNEAAITAAAFDNEKFTAPTDPQLVNHARQNGYPDDAVWTEDYANMQAGLPMINIAGPDDNQPLYVKNFKPKADWTAAQATMLGQGLTPVPIYDYRWQQSRGSGLTDFDLPSSQPARGPWKGLFKDNHLLTKIINTYNTTDDALRTAWFACNMIQKPYGLELFGSGKDHQYAQIWGHLPNDDPTSAGVWDDGYVSHANVIRQWAELAYWFPSMSLPVGMQELKVEGVTNEPFDVYGQSTSSIYDGDSHSYLNNKTFSKVWPAFDKLKALMAAP